MDGRDLEPRMTLWAAAEISWEDSAGTPFRAPATLEDISVSEACIRVKSPVSVGSKVTIKWKRVQFSAIARNCRSDGREFLLGVRRDPKLLQTGSLPRELPRAAVAKSGREKKNRCSFPDKSHGPNDRCGRWRPFPTSRALYAAPPERQ